MEQVIPPAIKALAHQHRLGTPLKRSTPWGMLLFFCSTLVFFVVVDVLYLLNLLTHPSHLDLAQVAAVEVLVLGLSGYFLYTIWILCSTYYYLCTEGFLELKRSNPPTVKHALRWDEVSSTSMSGRGYPLFVTDTQGRRFRITSYAIWNRCKEQLKGKQGKRKQSRKRT